MKKQCSICKALKNGDNWEPWPYLEINASHTYCPPCAQVMREQIEKYRPKKGDKNG